MIKHHFSFKWSGKPYNAVFTKVASKHPIIFIVSDFELSIDTDAISFVFDNPGSDQYSVDTGGKRLPNGMIDAIWEAIFNECQRIGLNIEDLNTV